MRYCHAAIAGAFALTLGTAAAQDVEATFSIKPSGTDVPCQLSSRTIDAITGSVTPDKIAALTGCPGRKISSFELLGNVTDTYEFVDGRNRLQVTFQNNKVLSRTLRRS